MKKNDKNMFIKVHILLKKKMTGMMLYVRNLMSSFGDTVEEADKNLREAIILYLEGIDELKIEDQVFKKNLLKRQTKVDKGRQ